MYFLDSVSTLIFSPVVMNRGTLMIAPAATLAGCRRGEKGVGGGVDSERESEVEAAHDKTRGGGHIGEK